MKKKTSLIKELLQENCVLPMTIYVDNTDIR